MPDPYCSTPKHRSQWLFTVLWLALVSGLTSCAHSQSTTRPAAPSPAFVLSGNWKASTLPGPNAEHDSYWTAEVGATATFSPAFDAPVQAKVAVWRIVHASNNDPAVPIEVRHGGKTARHTLDCSTGESGWVELGTYDFAGASDESVRLTKATPTVATRAAAVRFDVLGSGGSVITSLTLDHVTAGPLAKQVVAFDPSKVRAGPPDPDQWERLFADEFDALDKDTWSIEAGSPGHILSSRWPENLEVKDGVLRFLTRKEQRGGKQWTTANIWTKTARFQYGYFEARMKIGRARGLNNAFWLMTQGKKTDPMHFEIDIAEAKYPATVNVALHNWSGEHQATGHAFKAPYNLADDFHLYAVEWNETEITWYVDGQEIYRKKHEIARLPSPLRLSSAVGAFAGPITDALDGTAMEVDYVRVWRRKGP